MFKWRDAAMPQKAGQLPEDRAKDFEKVLSWMRSCGVNPEDEETHISSFDKLNNLLASHHSPLDQAKEMQAQLSYPLLRCHHSFPIVANIGNVLYLGIYVERPHDLRHH